VTKDEKQLKKEQKLEEERRRIVQLGEYERQYQHKGWIAGIDEVGRGPIAGPVVAAAVILPKECEILYINDSKKLSKNKRELICSQIEEKAIAIGLGLVSSVRRCLIISI